MQDRSITHSRFIAPAHPRVRAVPAFQDNYIWLVRGADGRHAMVVDPGDAAPVQAALDEEGLVLSAILLTHHHADHVGGVKELVARHAPAVIGPRDPRLPCLTRPVEDEEIVELPGLGLRMRAIDVPGHTVGHMAFACQPFGGDPRPLLFCGDTLFAAGCGRLFEGTPGQMHGSLTRLALLDPATLVYCAHEYTASNLRFARAVLPDDAVVAARQDDAAAQRERHLPTLPSTIGVERDTNPFLRTHDPAVRAAAARRLGHAPADDVDVLAALRAWKDVFA